MNKLMMISFFLIAALTSNLVNAQQYYWYDGDKQIPIEIVQDVEAEVIIDAQTGTRRTLSTSTNLSEISRNGAIRFMRRTSTGANRGTRTTTQTTGIPVFRTNNNDKTFMALTGGIILSFKSNVLVSIQTAWLQDKSLEVERSFTLKDKNYYLVKTLAGIESLNTANLYKQDPLISSSTPNWYRSNEPKKVRNVFPKRDNFVIKNYTNR
jgi:hypothetical protein